ncbi:MAG TPA: cytochrome c oxidase subunit 3 family protein [Candidatus Acidoferrales bacterium]|jgi:cytochrome c oxidase subunit 3|nr:cytochrome c oxidase subunit 3 family protein [Candidatus Acidoferrales bacterium]
MTEMAHSATRAALRHHFDDLNQQHAAGTLGMWVFLVTEIMFFGGLFAAYAIYRSLYLTGFEAGSRLLDIKLGAINTAVLIASSLTMALAVHAAQTSSRKALIVFLILTMILGGVFLGIKYVEYHHKWETQLVPGLRFSPGTEIPQKISLAQVELFFCFYFFMTALHATHMVVGIGILAALVVMAARNRFSANYFAPVEVSGLYWHFVDIIWIFLFPLLYLIGGRY